jgi:hypothetical protein
VSSKLTELEFPAGLATTRKLPGMSFAERVGATATPEELVLTEV